MLEYAPGITAGFCVVYSVAMLIIISNEYYRFNVVYCYCNNAVPAPVDKSARRIS